MSEAVATKKSEIQTPNNISVSERLEKAISELRSLHELLLAGEGLDPRILSDFRDSLNRVRNTAWSAQQYLVAKNAGEAPTTVLSILSEERVRVTYQLCQVLQDDLSKSDVLFQKGPLIQLHRAVELLGEQLRKIVNSEE
jgi:hypothetical protein